MKRRLDFYGVTADGGQVRLGMPITSDSRRVGFFAGLEQKRASSTRNSPAALPVLMRCWLSTASRLIRPGVGYTLTYDGLDDPKKPTEGLYATFAQQYIGWDHYPSSRKPALASFTCRRDTGIRTSGRGTAGMINDFGNPGVHPLEAYQPRPTFVRKLVRAAMARVSVAGQPVGAAVCRWFGRTRVPDPRPARRTTASSAAIWARAGYVVVLPTRWQCDRSEQHRQPAQGFGRCVADLGQPVRPAAWRRRLRGQQGNVRPDADLPADLQSLLWAMPGAPGV